MSQPWSPECVVSPALARALIEAQFPALVPAKVVLLGAGWDNTAFRVNETSVFRFPRRQIAVPFIEAEANLLPALAPRLPLPIPIPTWVGRASEQFPWPFAGYRMLPGRTACAADLNEEQRAAAAEPLACFLAALHAVPSAEAARHGAALSTFPRLDFDRRIAQARDHLNHAAAHGFLPDIKNLTAILDSTPTVYTARVDVLVHGDLYVRHLLVNHDHQLAGVIDWGDVHLGDPALDLAIAHTFLPPSVHSSFRQIYGPIHDATWQMARLRGLWHTTMVLMYGHGIGDTDLVREARLGLDYIAGS